MKKLFLAASALVAGAAVAAASSLSVPWFVDNGVERRGIGTTANTGIATIVYLKSNRSDTLVATIRYFTPGGVFLGPTDPPYNTAANGGVGNFATLGNTFALRPFASVAFRPTINDPFFGNPDPVEGNNTSTPGVGYALGLEQGEVAIREGATYVDTNNNGVVDYGDSGVIGFGGVFVPNQPRNQRVDPATNQAVANTGNIPIDGVQNGVGGNGSISIIWEGGPTDIQGALTYFQTNNVGLNGNNNQVVGYTYGYTLPAGA